MGALKITPPPDPYTPLCLCKPALPAAWCHGGWWCCKAIRQSNKEAAAASSSSSTYSRFARADCGRLGVQLWQVYVERI